MDAYIEQILAEMPDEQSTLHDVVKNILDEPIPEDVKARLLKPLQPGKYQPPPRKKKAAKREAIKEEFDPISPDNKKTLRSVKEYQDEILDLFTEVKTDELPGSVPADQQFIDLDDQVPSPVRLPADESWVEALTEAKEEFEVDGAAAVFSTWRVEAEDPLDTGDVKVAAGMYARAGRIALDSRMTKERAAALLAALPKGEYMLRLKFLRERTEGDWVVEDKFDPVRAERKKGQAVVQLSQDTKPGALHGIDGAYYEKAYPVTAVVYGLYPIREADAANLAPLRDGDLNCVARRVIEHFEGAQRGQGLTPTRRQKIQEWEERVHETGATVDDVAELERILKRAIILRDIAGEDIYNSGKYRFHGNGVRGKVELIAHNGHAWPKDLHFPQAREVRIYGGDVWQAIQEATQGEPIAVWLLGGSQDNRLSVDQFVLQDGRTYRTQEAHQRLQDVCRALGDEGLADRAFGENHAASIKAKERNGWKPIPASFLNDIQKACVEHGHGGLWNSMDYDTREIVSIDMKACYPASFKGQGEARPYFQRFGHPGHRMTRVAINSTLPEDIGTGFAEVQEWKFDPTVHPVIPAWFGKHFSVNSWAPTPLLAYLVEKGLLTSLKVREAIIAFEKQAEIWLPEDRDQGCSIIGKFTQGSKAEGKRMTRRLVTDQGELDFLVRDTRQSGTLVGAPQRCPLGHVLTYYDGTQPQYAHLRASMLAYAHINLLDMLRRFTPDEAVRVATDSIYIQKTALHKLEGVKAYAPHDQHPKGYCTACCLFHDTPVLRTPREVAPAQWRDKGEQLYMPMEHAAYLPKPEHRKQQKDMPESTAPCYNDPLTRHQMSYLNGGGGSGKTTRAIELFCTRDPLVFTPTHRLAKEMRVRGVKAQTYHSFFRWSGQTEWTPERMGQKFIPRVIIWDEVCTVPRPILETFLDWLDQRGVQVVCCGDQGQPPPIAGEMPHNWLRQKADHYEEVEVDHRAKDPELRDLKRRIRLRPDKDQCREMRRALPSCLGWDPFVDAWKPGDLILTSRQKVRDRAQRLLLQKHKERFPDVAVPLLYHPIDTRRQNIQVMVPGTRRTEELVLNDIVDVPIDAVETAIQTGDWRLGYSITVHSSQGLTIHNPQKVWIIDDYLQWSNLAYLAVSRVEYMHQLERVVCPPEEGSEAKQLTEQQLRKAIQRKLVAYKRQDKNGRMGFNLKVDHILQLKEAQSNHCAACNIELLWAYAPKDTQQFSVDRLDNSRGHTHDNVRLTCLECNRKRGGAALTA